MHGGECSHTSFFCRAQFQPVLLPVQALEEAKNRDRLYIPSRYQLFTLNQVRQVRLRT